jgi:predicted amidohydrolase
MKQNIEEDGELLMREAVKKGAQIVLPSELFQNIYFCVDAGSTLVQRSPSLAEEHPCRHSACRNSPRN